MKIERLFLKNIRCFDELELKFEGRSALIIGDNGDGKSTVIRSLAMSLCDDSSASALFRDLHGETIRRGHEAGRIEVDLRSGRDVFRTVTEIKSLRTFERVEQSVYRRGQSTGRFQKFSQRRFPWSRIFATGYGPGIRVQGTADYDYYLAVDALYPLFRYDVLLQNPELVVRRLVDSARRNGRGDRAADAVLTSIKSLLTTVLQLDDRDQIELTRTGISISGRWGRSELSSVGDGYRSTVTWVLDLLSWWFLRTGHKSHPKNPVAIQGIVLLDEVEQHLHPRWQRNIMRLLSESFPRVQFIATTHSPLVASGSEEIPVHRLNKGVHSIVTPFGWLAEDVYEMMGLPSSRAKTFVTDVLEEFERLDAKRLRSKLSPAEQRQFTRLRDRLGSLPGDDPARLSTELKNLTARAKELAGGTS